MIRSLVRFSLVPYILLLLISFPYSTCTISVDTPDRDPDTGKPLLKLTTSQLCEACQTTIEDFYIMMVQAVAKGTRDLSFTHEELLTQFCQGWPITSYHRHYEWGCLKLLSENFQEILGPFMGHLTTQDFPSYRQVFDHRTKMCHKYANCEWEKYPYPDIIPRTACDACERIVADASWMIERHKMKNMTLVRGTVEGVCNFIPIRHIQHEVVHDMCHSLIDDYPDAMAQALFNFDKEKDSLTDVQWEICGLAAHHCSKKAGGISVHTYPIDYEEAAKTDADRKREKRLAIEERDRKRKLKKEKKAKQAAEAEALRAERAASKKAERERERVEKEERERLGLSEEQPVEEPTLDEIVAKKEKAVPFRKMDNNNNKQTNTDQPLDNNHHKASGTKKDEL